MYQETGHFKGFRKVYFLIFPSYIYPVPGTCAVQGTAKKGGPDRAALIIGSYNRIIPVQRA